jgi:hypothetical protein
VSGVTAPGDRIEIGLAAILRVSYWLKRLVKRSKQSGYEAGGPFYVFWVHQHKLDVHTQKQARKPAPEADPVNENKKKRQRDRADR